MPKKSPAFPIPKCASVPCGTGNGDLQTLAQIRAEWGFGEKKTRDLLRQGILSGEIAVEIALLPDITGKLNRTVLYRSLR